MLGPFFAVVSAGLEDADEDAGAERSGISDFFCQGAFLGIAFALILPGKWKNTNVSLSVVSSAGSLLSFLAAAVAFSDTFGLSRQFLFSCPP